MTEQTPQTPNSEDIAQKEIILEIPDGAKPEYHATPRRKYEDKVVKGIAIGRGENRRVIPLEEVEKLAGLHLSYKDMADFYGCKVRTFEDNFRDVVERARGKTKQKLMMAMLENAIERKNATIQIWLSKNLLGFTDNPINNESNQVLPWLDEGNGQD